MKIKRKPYMEHFILSDNHYYIPTGVKDGWVRFDRVAYGVNTVYIEEERIPAEMMREIKQIISERVLKKLTK